MLHGMERKCNVMVPVELDEVITKTTTVTISYDVREPLCED